ncbi:acyltransferase [Aquabacterium sp. CECT 9606]|uniref:acyltransferase family protein n=1 Tax=Aquabacterium sp. CECT 9606 TaxID=2845822 RepID=UPI001E3AEEFA|nr:acyltransferase [Aquabacterium sp. CECT 9606]
MRITLALIILCFHTAVTTGGMVTQQAINSSPAGLLIGMLLPLFFALSGYLVSGSLERSKSLGVFLGLRGLRIFPALAIDTLLCALVLGPLVTTLPLNDYFQHPQFIQYFQNILGIIHYHLPGVFESNPMSEVNGQLWTIPSELECYILLAALAAVGLHKRRSLLLGVVMAATAALEYRTAVQGVPGWVGRMIVLCFIAGVLVNAYRDRIRLNGVAFIAATALTAICLRTPALIYVTPFPAAYMMVCLGYLNPRKSKFLESGDYSYGLFLYGFPIQQLIVATTHFGRTWYGNLVLSLPIALAFAVMSWHVFEKRALNQKKYLFAFDRWWVSTAPGRLLRGKG